MIIREISKITNDSLHDAILIAENMGFKFKSLYVDRNWECSITFDGEMPEKAIQLFFANINPNVNCDSEISEEIVVYNKDYTYGFDDLLTEIYTRDGWKY